MASGSGTGGDAKAIDPPAEQPFGDRVERTVCVQEGGRCPGRASGLAQKGPLGVKAVHAGA